ncbi:MAG: hypothetical protein IPM61_14590 [Chlorobi bacterium]|nr:hypothetical protein [Chlorobiota bacterium]MBX7216350.1 hypothetical protein [Candidatus Kapabacteria bacterium]
MNTNDIQELFEGTLSDEQMAEALHVLSVSPERRTAFRQHMALRDAIEKDRLTNGLRPEEDAAIWGAIAGGSGIVANPVARPFLGGWMRRGIALATAGVVGYILGSTQFGNLFGGGDAAGSQQGGSVEAVSTIAPATSLDLQTTTLQAAVLQAVVDKAGSAPNLSASAVSASASEPRVIYRDRIIRVPVPVASGGTSNSPRLAAADGLRNSATASEQNNTSANSISTNNNAEKSVAENGQSLTAPPFNLSTSLLATQNGTSNGQTLGSNLGNTLASNRGSDRNGTNASTLLSNGAAPNSTAPSSKPDNVNNNSGKGAAPVATSPTADPTRANGLELIYSERLGLLAPTPQGITNPDREFSNRSIGAIYRFGEGEFGLGARMVYGTLASVSLQKVGENITGGNDYGPVLNASKKLWVEAVGNYRIPLSEKMALNFEGSFGTNSTSTLYGADAFVVWYFTNTIGAQLGAGVASYSYDLREERRKLIEGSLNDGVVSTASDTYRGTLIQGRYGLFFRF